MNTVSKFSENYFSNIFLVTIASGVHLFPSRTQKLSHLTPTIVNAKIGSCQEFFLFKKRVLQKSRTFFLKRKKKIGIMKKNKRRRKEELKKVKKN